MKHNYFKTTDGVKLHYKKTGQGPTLLYLPCFLGDSNALNTNYKELGKHFTVYAFDYRGHGYSDTPDYGWKISRLAKDLEELIEFLELDTFYLLCHSMGCAVAWSYISLFGENKIEKLILQDETPCLMANPIWNFDERKRYSGRVKKTNAWNLLNEFGKSKENCIEALKEFLNIEDEIKLDNYSKEKYSKLGKLLFDHITNDWREEIKQISSPVLYIGGLLSSSTLPETHHWFNNNIKDIQAVIFSEEDIGTHYMHITNPKKFNNIVINYLV